MQITDTEKVLINALIDSVRVMRQWHGKEAFDIYFNHAPEMKSVRDTLLAYGMSFQDVLTGNHFVL